MDPRLALKDDSSVWVCDSAHSACDAIPSGIPLPPNTPSYSTYAQCCAACNSCKPKKKPRYSCIRGPLGLSTCLPSGDGRGYRSMYECCRSCPSGCQGMWACAGAPGADCVMDLSGTQGPYSACCNRKTCPTCPRTGDNQGWWIALTVVIVFAVITGIVVAWRYAEARSKRNRTIEMQPMNPNQPARFT